MSEIRHSDQGRLLDFVREVGVTSGTESFENFPGKLAGSLARLLPSLHVTYNEFCPQRSEICNVGNTPDISGPEMIPLLGMYIDKHPHLVYALGSNDGQAFRISDFVSLGQFRNTALYADLYRLYGWRDDLSIGLSSDPSRLSSITWHGDRRFTDRERDIANLVRPFAIQAWQNARLLDEMNIQLGLMQRGLESAALGVIACGSRGRVRMITPLAHQYLTEYFGATRNSDRQLPAEVLGWLRGPSTHRKVNEMPFLRVPLTARRGNHLLIVRLVERPEADFLLLEENTVPRIVVSFDQLPLSRRESEVLAWVAKGKTNGDIAAILGISLFTTKRHLEHILEKLGVETRTAAAAVALQSLPRNQ